MLYPKERCAEDAQFDSAMKTLEVSGKARRVIAQDGLAGLNETETRHALEYTIEFEGRLVLLPQISRRDPYPEGRALTTLGAAWPGPTQGG
jgi:hypothetical protein